MIQIEKILDYAIQHDASDIHFICDIKPMVRIARELKEVEDTEVLTLEDMNEIYDYLDEIVVLRNNEIDTLGKGDFEVSYRDTEFKKNNDIILRACFCLDKGNKEELESIIKENRLKRQNSQPLEYKNAGSVFKNPEGMFAGKLIEDAGLKGYKIVVILKN